MKTDGQAAISFDNVQKSFNGREVLKGVSFDILQGEALCILGKSGTGKSITLKLMIGLFRPDAGTICVENEDIVNMNEDQLVKVRRKMRFLFQGAALFDSFSLNDNLALPLIRLKRMHGREVKERVERALGDVGLEKEGKKMPAELSGGMRKRAGLARALILEPSILLVDEPSSGLDRVTASEIDELLLKQKEEKQTTIVIVSHDVHGARRVGDRLAVLDEGKVAALGTPEELEKSDNDLVKALISKD